MIRAAMVLLLIPLAGCIGADTVDDATVAAAPAYSGFWEAPLSEPGTLRAGGLGRADLEAGKVHLEVAGGWQAARFQVDQEFLGPEGTVTLSLASQPEPGAQPYLILAIAVMSGGDGPQPPPVLIPIALPDTPQTMPIQITASGSEGGTEMRSELAFITGTNHGNASFAIGITADGATGEAVLRALADRPALPVIPQYRGDGGFVGTYVDLYAADGTHHEVQAGHVEITRSTGLSGPAGIKVDDRLTMRVPETPLATAGTGALLTMAFEQAALQQWSIDAEMGQYTFHKEGTYANVGPIVAPVVSSIDGFEAMALVAMARTEPGSFHLDADRVSTGKEGMTDIQAVDEAAGVASGAMTTAGWFSGDLEAMYGWPWQDFLPQP